MRRMNHGLKRPVVFFVQTYIPVYRQVRNMSTSRHFVPALRGSGCKASTRGGRVVRIPRRMCSAVLRGLPFSGTYMRNKL